MGVVHTPTKAHLVGHNHLHLKAGKHSQLWHTGWPFRLAASLVFPNSPVSRSTAFGYWQFQRTS